MKLHFYKSGEGEPLIIIHGLFGSGDNWISLAKQFAEHYTVYLLDMRNHGHSPHDEVFNYDVMAEDVHAFMNDEQIMYAHFIGHSMGGKVIMRHAQRWPDRRRPDNCLSQAGSCVYKHRHRWLQMRDSRDQCRYR